MSNDRSSRPSDSTTMGTSAIAPPLYSATLRLHILPATYRLHEEASMQVEREIFVPSSPDEVWRALTDAEELKCWFANDVELVPEPGGRAVFRWSNGEEREAVVEDIEPERRLALRWLDDGGLVTLELDEA